MRVMRLACSRAGQPPTAAAAASPFSEIYVRKLARENGIPDYPLRRFPKARGELVARLPPGVTRLGRSASWAWGWGLVDRPDRQEGPGEPGGAVGRHRGPADPLGDQGRRGRGRGGRRGPRGPGRVPAGPVAVRAPQPGRGAASAPSPVRPHRDRGNPGRPVARTRTAPAGPDRASGCGWPRRDRSAASAAGLCPRTHAPAGALCPAGRDGHSHAHREDGRQFMANEPRHRRGNPRRLRLPAGLSPGPACPAAA